MVRITCPLPHLECGVGVRKSETLVTLFCLTPFAILPLCLRAEAVDWRLVVRLAIALVSEWTRWPPHVIKNHHAGVEIECFLVRELNITIPKKTPFFFLMTTE